MGEVKIIHGDCLEVLRGMDAESVHCCVTSPPYWGLRDYGVSGQLGLEKTPEEYVARMVEVFREVRRVLRDDGTLWLNLGDSYTPQSTHRAAPGTRGGLNQRGRNLKDILKPQPWGKPKDLVGIPWRVAFALQADGWYLRSDIIWSKPNPMPESVTDRPTKAHEYIFLLSKSARYYYDMEAVRENFADDRMGCPGTPSPKAAQIPGQRAHTIGTKAWQSTAHGRNRRSVWTVTTKPLKLAHFATFPPDLIRPCILAGCPVDGTVLDPFSGAGTTGLVAKQEGRNAILIELNTDYCGIARKRIEAVLV